MATFSGACSSRRRVLERASCTFRAFRISPPRASASARRWLRSAVGERAAAARRARILWTRFPVRCAATLQVSSAFKSLLERSFFWQRSWAWARPSTASRKRPRPSRSFARRVSSRATSHGDPEGRGRPVAGVSLGSRTEGPQAMARHETTRYRETRGWGEREGVLRAPLGDRLSPREERRGFFHSAVDMCFRIVQKRGDHQPRGGDRGEGGRASGRRRWQRTTRCRRWQRTTRRRR